MEQWRRTLYGLNPYLLSTTSTVFFILQIALAFLLFDRSGVPVLRLAGWILWAIGAAFGILPTFTLRAKGGVSPGRPTADTARVVDSGLYAVVRHPQYLAQEFLCPAVMLIAQHWVVVVIGIVPMVLTYLDAIREDQACIRKFGDDYRRYMQRVPRMNLVAGVIRLLQRKHGGAD